MFCTIKIAIFIKKKLNYLIENIHILQDQLNINIENIKRKYTDSHFYMLDKDLINDKFIENENILKILLNKGNKYLLSQTKNKLLKGNIIYYNDDFENFENFNFVEENFKIIFCFKEIVKIYRKNVFNRKNHTNSYLYLNLYLKFAYNFNKYFKFDVDPKKSIPLDYNKWIEQTKIINQNNLIQLVSNLI